MCSNPSRCRRSASDPDLRQLVDFGWLGLIARPLFLWLKWTYDHIVPNWGWAIVIQTLIINLALLPLRISSMKSALKMQKLQPQMNSIKEKYKKYSMRDPRKQEMNQEIAALYKEGRRESAGGCLPLIIQMPFLFAYYRMLGVALDLRHAHWLWIKDLSSPDPYYILPIADYHHHAVHAAHDAAGRYGSRAAEDDEPHDAADAGLYQLEPRCRVVPLLVGRQLDRDRAAVDHEPNATRAAKCAK